MGQHASTVDRGTKGCEEPTVSHGDICVMKTPHYNGLTNARVDVVRNASYRIGDLHYWTLMK